jgi:hypothetical protein
LNRYGVTPQLKEQSELLGNVTGGRRDGFEYETTACLSRAASVSALHIHDRNPTVENLSLSKGGEGWVLRSTPCPFNDS